MTGCNKSSQSASSAKAGSPVQQKLQELAGSNATDCGYMKTMAPDQLKPASTCAMDAAQKKQPFYVAYEMPGLTIAVAGNSEGKLYTVSMEQPQGAQGAAADIKSDPCPSDLRLAESGRVTCFAPGSFMGTSGASPHGGMMSMPGSMPGSPHGGMTMPPPGTPNPHASKEPQKK